jgi:hypothetical protein
VLVLSSPGARVRIEGIVLPHRHLPVGDDLVRLEEQIDETRARRDVAHTDEGRSHIGVKDVVRVEPGQDLARRGSPQIVEGKPDADLEEVTLDHVAAIRAHEPPAVEPGDVVVNGGISERKQLEDIACLGQLPPQVILAVEERIQDLVLHRTLLEAVNR